MGATLATVDVRAIVGPDAEPAAVARLGRALGDPLLAALPAAFDRLERVDPGGYWVVRDLHVHMALAGIDTDVDAIARAVAAALAEGIATAVAGGPGPEVIRFAGRAAYAAAYAAARSVGISGGWVFAPLHPVEALPVPDALVAASRMLDVPVAQSVLAFAEHPSWQRMVDAATAEQADRLVATLRSVRGTLAAGASGAAGPPVDLAVLLPTGRRMLAASGVLALLGRAVRAAGPSPRVLAAVLDLTVDAGPAGTAGGGSAGHEPLARPPVTPGSELEATRGDGVRDHAEVGSAWSAPEGVDSPGATAFVLLPDLAELLAGTVLDGRGPAVSEVRARLLRAVLGPAIVPDDPGLLLAAGLTPLDDADADEGGVPEPEAAAALSRLADRISTDELLGRRHPDDAGFVTRAGDPVDPATVTVAVALLRRFARHLPGFGNAAAGYLIPQVLVPGGRTRVLPGMIEATLVTAPLGVLLALAGLDAFVAGVPWLPLPFTLTHEDRS